MMPDLSKCRQIGSKLICWSKEKQRFVEVILKPLDIKEVDWDMISGFVGDCETQQAGSEVNYE